MSFGFETYPNFKLRHVDDQIRRVPFGVQFLDDALKAIMPRDLILIGARTGCGKTQLATSIALKASQIINNVHFFALEAEKHEITDRMVYSEIAGEFYRRGLNRKFPKVVMRYQDWRTGDIPEKGLLDELEPWAIKQVQTKTLGLEIHYRDRNFTVDDFVKHVDHLEQQQARLIIVDHLHFFDFLKGEREMEGLQRAVKKIREAVMDKGIPVILLAQLRKGAGRAKMPEIEDLHGHSDIAKAATAVLLLSKAERAQEEKTNGKGGQQETMDLKLKPTPGKVLTYLHLAKARHAGDAQDYAGVLTFDLTSGTYDREYLLAQVPAVGEPRLLNAKGEMPRWARNATEPIF